MKKTTIKLRRKELKKSYSLYLDIYSKGKRRYKYLGIYINKTDSKKDIILKEKIAFIELEKEYSRLKETIFNLKNNNRGVNGLNELCNNLIQECEYDYSHFIDKISKYLKSKYKHSTYVYYYGLIKHYIIYDLGIILDEFKARSIEKMNFDTYLLRVGSSELYKIGKTSNLEQRLKYFDLHTGKYEFIQLIKGDIEKFLHNKFKEKWIQNEFFNLNKDDIDYIKNL